MMSLPVLSIVRLYNILDDSANLNIGFRRKKSTKILLSFFHRRFKNEFELNTTRIQITLKSVEVNSTRFFAGLKNSSADFRYFAQFVQFLF